MIAGEPVWMRMIKDLLREIRERYHLNLIDLDRKNQEFKKASGRIDAFLSRFDQEEFYYLYALDGVLMLAEGQVPEAHARFKECLTKLPRTEDANSHYVSLFCNCLLSLRESTEAWRELRQEALDIHPSTKIRRFLSFPTEEKLNKIVNDS